MNIAKLLHHEIDKLPENKIQEVLDFLLFIKNRNEHYQWQDLLAAQEKSLYPVWDNTDDEIWNDL